MVPSHESLSSFLPQVPILIVHHHWFHPTQWLMNKHVFSNTYALENIYHHTKNTIPWHVSHPFPRNSWFWNFSFGWLVLVKLLVVCLFQEVSGGWQQF